MIINKITSGYVIQCFDTEKGEFVSQEFVAGEVDWEYRNGEPIEFDDVPSSAQKECLPFHMVQP